MSPADGAPEPTELPPPFSRGLTTWPRVYLAVVTSQLVFVVLVAILCEVCA